MSGANVSVIVITHNEEENIADCLGSVEWATERIVVDAMSTDRTAEIARSSTPHVHVTAWKGFGGAKAYGLERATCDWILWLDADERVPPELAKEIVGITGRRDGDIAGWEVARRAFFLGKWIRHCGWYPGYVLRLFKRSAGLFSDSQVHEKVNLRGATGRLRNDLLHYTDRTLFHYFAKFNRYTSLAARDLHAKGRDCSWYDLLVRPPFQFVKMYVIRRGFLDGMHGFVLSLLSAAYVFIKYAKSWELASTGRGAGNG